MALVGLLSWISIFVAVFLTEAAVGEGGVAVLMLGLACIRSTLGKVAEESNFLTSWKDP